MTGLREEVAEALLAIALCHNVSPVESLSTSAADGFQGASPDELALVQSAARCGLVLHERTPDSITLHDRCACSWPAGLPYRP